MSTKTISSMCRNASASILLIAGCLLAAPCAAIFQIEANAKADVPEAVTAAPEPADALIDGRTPVERASAMLAYCAKTRPRHDTFAKEAMFYYVARIFLKTDVPYAISQWQKTAAKTLAEAQGGVNERSSHGSNNMEPFDKHVLVWSWILCHEKVSLPPDILENTKKYVALWRHRKWEGYGAPNYRLMMDGSGFLAAEQWPDLVDADGLNAEQIMQATKERLMGYFRDIAVNNISEYGSPAYLGVDLSAMKMLAEEAHDPEVRKAATAALDAMFLQMAPAWNHGYLITPAGRSKYWSPSVCTPEDMEPAGACAWIFWGASRPVHAAGLGAHHSGWLAIPGYAPPPLYAKIASDRSKPITYRESFVDKNNRVSISLFQAPQYGLASQWEAEQSAHGAISKEMKREMFKWVSDRPASSFIPLQENMERPYNLHDTRKNVFGYGENPYAQVLQSEATLICVCKVDESYPYWKIYAPFTTEGAILKKIEKNGWVFCHGGTVLFAFKTIAPYTWATPEHHCDILQSDDRTNGWVLETSPLTPFAGGGVDTELEHFAAAVLSKVSIDSTAMTGPTPNLKVLNLAGRKLDLTFRPLGPPYTNQHKVDGASIDYASFPLISTPQLLQKVGDVHQNINGSP